jgi:hypothetical protein
VNGDSRSGARARNALADAGSWTSWIPRSWDGRRCLNPVRVVHGDHGEVASGSFPPGAGRESITAPHGAPGTARCGARRAPRARPGRRARAVVDPRGAPGRGPRGGRCRRGPGHPGRRRDRRSGGRHHQQLLHRRRPARRRRRRGPRRAAAHAARRVRHPGRLEADGPDGVRRHRAGGRHAGPRARHRVLRRARRDRARRVAAHRPPGDPAHRRRRARDGRPARRRGARALPQARGPHDGPAGASDADHHDHGRPPPSGRPGRRPGHRPPPRVASRPVGEGRTARRARRRTSRAGTPRGHLAPGHHARPPVRTAVRLVM